VKKGFKRRKWRDYNGRKGTKKWTAGNGRHAFKEGIQREYNGRKGTEEWTAGLKGRHLRKDFNERTKENKMEGWKAGSKGRLGHIHFMC
jgi:hypothetical protein